MGKKSGIITSRRGVLKGAAATAGLAAAAGFVPTRFAIGQTAPLKIGFMLPYSGTYAQLGQAITEAFKLYVDEQGGALGGRQVEYVQLDSEADPSKAPENMNRLVSRDQVDFVVGPVHSGVAMGMAKVARDTDAMLVIPNAGVGAATGPLCAPNIFRASFSNWQPAYPMGSVAAEKGHKTAVTLSWKYGAGDESTGGFKEGFTKAGGEVIEEMFLPFPDVEFQSPLTRIASLGPDCVYVFFAGGGAIKFVKDYHAAGLRNSIPLYGPGFLTDGTLEAQGEAAEGLETTLHYGDGLDLPKNLAFREAFSKVSELEPDVYAVQGYDSAQLIDAGLKAVEGDTDARDEMVEAMETTEIDSPRGKFTLSKAHNPIQDIYLREVRDGKNMVVGVAAKALEDPARGCQLA
ncbi:MAG TPA: ABC transporter substrate-binding protein [Alphaproteobacteria bacterium]|nr:ABC transporter substrate-binding protein [Alphaproteobacteria bacterium]